MSLTEINMTALVLAVLIFLSWFNLEHFPPWVSWHSEILAFVALVGAVGGILFPNKLKIYVVCMPNVCLPIGLIAIVAVMQTALGSIEFVGDTWVLMFYAFLCMSAIAVGYKVGGVHTYDIQGFAATQSVLYCLAVLILAGALCSVVVALIQVLDVWSTVSGIHRMPGLRRPGGNLGQPNQLATLLVMGLASLCYVYELRKTSAAFASFLLVMLTFGVALTESRTGVLSCVFLAAWLLAWRDKTGLKTSPWVVVFGCAVLFTLLWVWPTFFAYLQAGGMANGEVVQINTNAGARRIVWPQLMEAVLQKPWFGWGLQGVSEAHNAVLHHYALAEPFTYAHNIVLDIAVGMGLPLTLLLVVVTAVWLWRRVRATKSLLPWYCLAVVLPFGVHSMLEFPFAYAYFLVPVMFVVGVLEANLVPQSVVRMGWWPVTVGFAVMTALMAWSVVEYIAIEEDFRVVRFEAMRLGQTPSDYERPKIYLLTHLDALLEAGRIAPAPGMAPERIELSRKVAMRYPWTATQNRYALSLALNGNQPEALRQLKVMRAMHGEKTYEGIKANWTELANTKYPQLKALTLP